MAVEFPTELSTRSLSLTAPSVKVYSQAVASSSTPVKRPEKQSKSKDLRNAARQRSPLLGQNSTPTKTSGNKLKATSSSLRGDLQRERIGQSSAIQKSTSNQIDSMSKIQTIKESLKEQQKENKLYNKFIQKSQVASNGYDQLRRDKASTEEYEIAKSISYSSQPDKSKNPKQLNQNIDQNLVNESSNDALAADFSFRLGRKLAADNKSNIASSGLSAWAQLTGKDNQNDSMKYYNDKLQGGGISDAASIAQLVRDSLYPQAINEQTLSNHDQRVNNIKSEDSDLSDVVRQVNGQDTIKAFDLGLKRTHKHQQQKPDAPNDKQDIFTELRISFKQYRQSKKKFNGANSVSSGRQKGQELVQHVAAVIIQYHWKQRKHVFQSKRELLKENNLPNSQLQKQQQQSITYQSQKSQAKRYISDSQQNTHDLLKQQSQTFAKKESSQSKYSDVSGSVHSNGSLLEEIKSLNEEDFKRLHQHLGKIEAEDQNKSIKTNNDTNFKTYLPITNVDQQNQGNVDTQVRRTSNSGDIQQGDKATWNRRREESGGGDTDPICSSPSVQSVVEQILANHSESLKQAQAVDGKYLQKKGPEDMHKQVESQRQIKKEIQLKQQHISAQENSQYSKLVQDNQSSQQRSELSVLNRPRHLSQDSHLDAYKNQFNTENVQQQHNRFSDEGGTLSMESVITSSAQVAFQPEMPNPTSLNSPLKQKQAAFDKILSFLEEENERADYQATSAVIAAQQDSPGEVQYEPKTVDLVNYSGHLSNKGSRAGTESQLPAASDSAPSAALAASVYGGVKAKISNMQREIKDRDNTIVALSRDLQKIQVAMKEAETSVEVKIAAALQKAQREHKAEESKLSGWIDKLMEQKAKQDENFEEQVEKNKAIQEQHSKEIEALKTGFVREINIQKEGWNAEEGRLRQEWEKKKVQEIKDMTVKGLEPDLRRLQEAQKDELKKQQQELEEQFQKQKDSIKQSHQLEVEGWRDKLLREREEVVQRERLNADTRLQELAQEYERKLQTQRLKLMCEKEQAEESAVTVGKSELRRAEDKIRALESEITEREKESQRRIEEGIAQARKGMEREIKEHKEQMVAEQAAYKEFILNKAKEEVNKKEAAVRKDMDTQREEQIKAICDRLGEDKASWQRELEQRSTEEVALLRDKHRREVAALRAEKDKIEDKFRKAHSDQAEAVSDARRLAQRVDELERGVGKGRDREDSLRERLAELEKQGEESRVRLNVEWQEKIRATKVEKQNALEQAQQATKKAEEMKKEVSQIRQRHEQELRYLEKRLSVTLEKKDEALRSTKQQLDKSQQQLRIFESELQKQRAELGL